MPGCLINNTAISGILRIGIWNIHGYKSKELGNKIKQTEVIEIIKRHDIFGVVESHAESNSDLEVEGFKYYARARPKSGTKYSGGGCVIYQQKSEKRGGIYTLKK